MAIDAIIAWTVETPDGLVLQLVARNSLAGPAGQERLTIVGLRTYRPRPGQAIWGSGIVEIADDPPQRYRQIGYTRLVEEATPQEDRP